MAGKPIIWRCFHCGETFSNAGSAKEHFGATQEDMPACRIAGYEGHLITYIRKLEAELARYRVDDSDVMRAILAQDADHRSNLQRAEERGYQRGVADMLPAAKHGDGDAGE